MIEPWVPVWLTNLVTGICRFPGSPLTMLFPGGWQLDGGKIRTHYLACDIKEVFSVHMGVIKERISVACDIME